MSILPTGIAAAIKGCVLACTITVRPGIYGELELANLHPLSRATVDLTGSTFTSVYLAQDSNILIRNGTASSTAPGSVCWRVDFSQNITLAGSQASNCTQAGFALARSSGVTLTYWRATQMGCDAVDVAGVTNFQVVNGSEVGSDDTHSQQCHPDAVQMYAYGYPVPPGGVGYPISQGTIANNVIVSGNFLEWDGKTRGQRGISGDTRNGPMDYLTITGNTTALHGSSCVQINSVAHLVAAGNTCINLYPQPWSSRNDFTGSAGTLGPNTTR